MKKLVMTVAVLACTASIVSALTVPSANVVGYSKVTLDDGFNMIRTPFQDGDANVDIQDLFDTSGLKAGADSSSADAIYFWDNAGLKYDIFFLHDGLGKGNLEKAGKWVDKDTSTIAVGVIAPETGIFYVRNDVASVTPILNGQAVDEPTGTNSLVLLEGFNMIANPFTSAWLLNDGSINWLAEGSTAGADSSSADAIYFWSNAGLKYDIFFLHDGLGKGNLNKAGKWVDKDTSTVDENLAAGLNEGFFYVRNGVGTITNNVPQQYSL